MLAKTLILVMFAAVVVSLGSGMVFLVKDRGRTQRTVKALTLRIGLSVALFAALFVLFATGVIAPHGVHP